MIFGLAPMDGFTDCAFRIITKKIFEKYNKKFNHSLFLRTEFMSADGYIANPIGVCKHLLATKFEKNLILQIHGGNENNLIKTVIDVQKKYSDYFIGIELNLGCPANNVMKSGGGAELLKDKKKALQIIKNIKSNISMSFSIKTRIGLDANDKDEQKNLILQASKYCDQICIHGRTVKQKYGGEVDRDFIKQIKSEIGDKCKIIGNGGIKSHEQISSQYTGLDGIMIGQGAIGNPRIFTNYLPSTQEKKETLLQHLNLMIAQDIYRNLEKIRIGKTKSEKKITIQMPSIADLENQINLFKKNIDNYDQIISKTLIEFRKHLFCYVKGILGAKVFKSKLINSKNYSQLNEAINIFFDN